MPTPDARGWNLDEQRKHGMQHHADASSAAPGHGQSMVYDSGSGLYVPRAPGLMRLGQRRGASPLDLHVTTDQAITIASASWVPYGILVTNVSTTLALSIAAGGIYAAASKTTALVGAGQAYTVLTNDKDVLWMTLALSNRRTETTIYFSLSTAHLAAASADLYVFGYPLDS